MVIVWVGCTEAPRTKALHKALRTEALHKALHEALHEALRMEALYEIDGILD